MAGPSVNAHYETSTERCGTIVGRCERFICECCDRLDLSFAIDRAASGRSPADERYTRRRFTCVNVVTVETSPLPVIVPPADDHRQMRGVLRDVLHFGRRC
jgi:hypothetical protein